MVLLERCFLKSKRLNSARQRVERFSVCVCVWMEKEREREAALKCKHPFCTN